MTRAERIDRIDPLLRRAPAGSTVLGFAIGMHPAIVAFVLAVLAAERAGAAHQSSPSSSCKEGVMPGAA